MFKRILIANRGEIACRIMKTARQMGIQTVAVYSTEDRNSLHVLQADSAVCIGPAPSKDSYLNIKAIIQAALESKAEAIHPGYGFLSEHTEFAQACADAGLIFIGPPVPALKAMASKQLAKQTLEHTSVPLTPGYHGADQSDKKLLEEAEKIGFPVLLKAAQGGGGKGMKAVKNKADFQAALESARRESMASFADQTMIIEKLISNPRHVEIQIIADNHGQVLHLFERDCSIQRRHQKIIEEAPAPDLPSDLRKGLTEAACEVAKTIGYRNAGTIEFLVDVQNQAFYFMEMNTRLQVEHPVTEMITGLDLVALQLKIAANEPLPFSQEDIQKQGHALECRIYAEDPDKDFLPSTGTIHFLKEPSGTGIRIDSGIQQYSRISQYYDPMIAKLIAFGNNREEALHRLQQALAQYAIGGVKTNIAFLQAICRNTAFAEAKLDTHFLEEQTIILEQPDYKQALLVAIAYDYLKLMQGSSLQYDYLKLMQGSSLQRETMGFQIHLKGFFIWRYVVQETVREVRVSCMNETQCEVHLDGQPYILTATLQKDTLILQTETTTIKNYVEERDNTLIIHSERGPARIDRYTWQTLQASDANKHALTAPMPATIVAILKNTGDAVKTGEGLMVLEAMKMEHTIHAPRDGTVKEIFYDTGAQVREGAELLALDE